MSSKLLFVMICLTTLSAAYGCGPVLFGQGAANFIRMTLGNFILTNFLVVLPAVYGCGQIPFGQEKTIKFNLTGFDLPAAMVYSPEVTAPSVAPTISTTETAAASFVRVLVDGSVRDVLYQQGRGAGLSDDVISLILQQLNIQVTYKVLKCDKVFDDFMNKGTMMLTNCLIVRDTVMNICIPAQNDMCHMPAEKKPVPQENLFISGSLKTSNIVMANWTREMWQTVLTRAVRSLTSGPLASNFFKASITITSIN